MGSGGPFGGSSRRWRNLLAAAARGALRLVRRLPLADRAEAFVLRAVWGTGSAEMLDVYLVSGYQNPRINLQSVLERHFLIQAVVGDAAHDLMRAEVRFAIELNEVLRRRARELGVTMGSYRDPAKHRAVRQVDAAIADREHEMIGRWRGQLDAHSSAERPSVIELACGSANDYRAYAEAGLDRHLQYVGIDLSPKNIANARRRHPDARFEVGDILDVRYGDRSFDFVVASDIFEHLSPRAMEHALDECARLARDALVLTFFNMHDAPEHEINPRGPYHWNRLSRDLVARRLRERGFRSIVAVPIGRWLRDRHGYPHSYNRHAWTLFAEREPRVTSRLPHDLTVGTPSP